MKAVTLSKIKKELNQKSREELLNYCLLLAKFKKDNKELLTYLIFEIDDEQEYIHQIKEWMDIQFNEINDKSYYYIRKSMRKILTQTKKYIRYSKIVKTEIELLLYYCEKMKDYSPNIKSSARLLNIYKTQLGLAINRNSKLHEDLQHDFVPQIESLEDFQQTS